MSLSLSLLIPLFFLSIVFLHIAKKNVGILVAYALQSLIVVIVLFGSYFETGALALLFVALLTFAIKVVLAPAFVFRTIKKNDLKFSSGTYLKAPLALIVIAGLTAIANSSLFASLTSIVPDHQRLLFLALSSLFISLFLIINRKDALPQIVGILSLENSILLFGVFAGLEQSAGLQAGIIFDIFIWIMIATIFVSMLLKHFGSLDVTEMRHLTD